MAGALKLDLVTHPELLEEDEYAARSAAWFYASRGCLLHSGDVERVTLLINGGRNGLEKRRALFNWRNQFWYEVSVGIETIIGLAALVISTIAGAFGTGPYSRHQQSRS